MRKWFFAIIFLCALATTCFAKPTNELQNKKTDTTASKLRNMPDFCQLDPRLPNGGREFCGPVAISNALAYMAIKGYSNLLTFSVDRAESKNQIITKDAGSKPIQKNLAMAQYNMIQSLGSDYYMKTARFCGTDPIDVLMGLEKYISDSGYKPIIEWQGYREGGKFACGELPNLNWMSENFSNSDKQKNNKALSNVVIEIGWYNYCQDCNSYVRNGGHYVTIADIENNDVNPKLIVHNPSTGGGANPNPQNCTLKKITTGKLEAWNNYPERPAKGFYIIEGLEMPSNAKIAILEGAIKFAIKN